MKYIIYASLFLIVSFIGFSCTSEEGISIDDPNGSKSPDTDNDNYKRTVLVYIVQSNLGSYLQLNINEIMAVATKKNLNGGNLVVFYSESKDNAELYEIKEDENGVPEKYPIKEYYGQSALSKSVMEGVIEEVVKRYPSDSYGMVLSSHGTAWLPTGYSSMLRSFGEESGVNMEINDLADAIPDDLFDFLIFDACSMGAIECMYELKDKAEYIVSSPSEILVSGFPYRNILSYFFTKTPELTKVAEEFYIYYRDKSDFKYGNVSLVDTKELDNLAVTVKDILSGKTGEDWFALPEDEMQLLSFLPSSPIKLYDFEDVIKYMATDEQYAQFMSSLNKAIPAKYSTSYIYCKGDKAEGYIVNVERFSGLSVYPLRENRTQLNNWYQRLEWYKAVF